MAGFLILAGSKAKLNISVVAIFCSVILLYYVANRLTCYQKLTNQLSLLHD